MAKQTPGSLSAQIDAQIDQIAQQADTELGGAGWERGTYIYMKALFKLAVLIAKARLGS